MRTLSKILWGFAIISLFLTFQVKNYNSFFLIISLLTGGISFYISDSLDKKELAKRNKEAANYRNKLIKKGLKIKVDLGLCRVISNKYRQEIINENYSSLDKYKALDSLAGRDTREFSNVVQSAVVYEQEIAGEKHKFYSQTFNKDETSIRYYLLQKKTAWLYVDPKNPKSYHFKI